MVPIQAWHGILGNNLGNLSGSEASPNHYWKHFFAFVIVAISCMTCLAVRAGTIFENSDTSWPAFEAPSTSLGYAQSVCANANSPDPCPSGATNFGYTTQNVWDADLSAIPNAIWIWAWAPNVDVTTTKAAGVSVYFEKRIPRPGPINPLSPGTVWLAADNEAKIEINGQLAIDTTSNRQMTQRAISLNALGTTGPITIRVTATNSTGSSMCADTYKCNPAGVVFAIKINFQDLSPPQCQVGQNDKQLCDPPLKGSKVRTCKDDETWSDWTYYCIAPTCYDENQRGYFPGERIHLQCPAGTVGFKVRPCNNTGWGRTFGGCKKRP